MKVLQYLLCSLVEASVLELLARIHRLNVFHVSDDVVRGIFALGDASSQGEALWLCPAQLVVGKSPLRLLLRLSTRLDILDHKLAPGALADDMAHLRSVYQTQLEDGFYYLRYRRH